ncbi:hypothetical protein [Burkholderia sp. Ac-20349]|uniref:hypothetical protein n=1 Tax=Burkholderia sp. Ac-20349 TaxID=2703893 RepID=UPI00197B4133|nr:hypothetical protein [Burkholderia sp. Ac-20349]MBN3840719.1 hypothetical protein [Burkholderia sp. Ac-20349]
MMCNVSRSLGQSGVQYAHAQKRQEPMGSDHANEISGNDERRAGPRKQVETQRRKQNHRAKDVREQFDRTLYGYSASIHAAATLARARDAEARKD